MSFQKPQQYKIKFSQNYIKADHVAEDSVNLMNLKPTDTVIEIGPGKGALTKFIIPKVLEVIGIEKDINSANDLKKQFPEIKVINIDILNYSFPQSGSYKVVGNIPFALTADILRKALRNSNPPTQVSFIMQKEAAERFLGKKENLFSLTYKPLYEGKIVKNFKKFDFTPVPNVDIVMLNIKAIDPVVEDYDLYLNFVTYCLTIWKANMGEVLKELFTHNQINVLKRSINLSLKPSEVSFTQWLNLFDSFNKFSTSKQKVIGASSNLKKQQSKLQKVNRTRKSY